MKNQWRDSMLATDLDCLRLVCLNVYSVEVESDERSTLATGVLKRTVRFAAVGTVIFAEK